MDLIRTRSRSDGIFGELSDGLGNFVCYTLEHAYPLAQGFTPKIGIGTYLCVKGPHRLLGMDHDFETFEITGVANHSNILFHPGNFNSDSQGCILLGDHIQELVPEHLSPASHLMVTNSKQTFEKFMGRLQNVKAFYLHVKNKPEIQG